MWTATSVPISGSNFATGGAVTVKFGSNAATGVTVNSATQITCTTPTGSAGTVDVAVTNPDIAVATEATRRPQGYLVYCCLSFCSSAMALSIAETRY
ncbi:MAG: IPT/TIG domain-containing protein [Planctomycetota bacterium]|nr:IPT/TIG domain-containing protein [Planctomycetota bacterium]